MATWATKADLILRYGQDVIEKMALRRDFNEEADDYVANETPERIDQVIETALQDAKDWILWKISCCFSLSEFLNLGDVNYIKRFHIKLTIAMLKDGGECKDCDDCKEEFSEFCSCGQICDVNGKCITKSKMSLIAVEKIEKSCLPENYCCACRNYRCNCG